MKALTAIAFLVVAALIVGGVWFFVLSGKPAGTSVPSDTGSSQPIIIPPAQNTSGQPQPQKVSVQQIPSPQDPAVAHDFSAKIQNSSAITLGGTVVVPPYALQIWGDENKGGEALLKEDPSGTTWNIVTLGGGEWTVGDLVGAGVPESYAEQLVAGLGGQ